MTQPSGTASPVQSKADAAKLLSGVRMFALLMICSVIAAGLELPWSVAAIGLSIGAIVVGARAVVLAARMSVQGLAKVGLIGGLALAALTLLMQLAVVASWPLQWDYQQCRAGALTEQAEIDCRTELEDRISRLSPLTR